MTTIYEYDILNRFPNHTLTKTTVNDRITWELKNGSSEHVNSASGLLNDDASVLRKLRIDLGFNGGVLNILTTAELALVTVPDRQMIFDITAGVMKMYDESGDQWNAV